MAAPAFQAEWINARIRRDGAEVELEFTDLAGRECQVRIETAVLKNLIGNLAQVLCSANNNASFGLPTEPDPAEYEDSPGFVIADRVHLHLADDGAAVLRVNTVSSKKWEVALNAEQATVLARQLAFAAPTKSMH